MPKLLRNLGASLAVIGMAVPAEVYANADCTCNVAAVGIDPTGAVVAQFSGYGYVRQWWLCSVSGSVTVNLGYGSGTMSSEACKAFYSQLLTARASNRSVVLSFYGPNDCLTGSLPPTNAQPSPYPYNSFF